MANARTPAVGGRPPSSAVARMAGCSDDQVNAALRRYAREGHTSIDPTDSVHVAAYNFLRHTTDRVCPHKLVQYIFGRQNKLKRGSEDAVEFWEYPSKTSQMGCHLKLKIVA